MKGVEGVKGVKRVEGAGKICQEHGLKRNSNLFPNYMIWGMVGCNQSRRASLYQVLGFGSRFVGSATFWLPGSRFESAK